MLEQDFVKQQFLKLYAKLKEHTNAINKPHGDESRTRDFERECFRACPCALKKKNNKVQIMLEQDFVKQPFLKLYAKLKENTNGIKKPHADKSRTRDFEKESFPCVSMCLKKEKSQNYVRAGFR